MSLPTVKRSGSLKDWLVYGLLGLLISFCLVMVAAGGLFYNEVAYTILPTGTPLPSNTPIPTETATPTITPTQLPATPTLDVPSLFNEVYAKTQNNDLQGAIDMLKEHLDEISEVPQKVLAVQTLGDLYSMQGNYQIAVVYYQQLYDLEPNAYGLYLIATTYDAAGNLYKAQEYYLRCLEMYDPNFPEDKRQEVKARSDELKAILTKATLTPIPTATPE